MAFPAGAAQAGIDGAANWIVRLRPDGDPIWINDRTGEARWASLTAEEWNRESDPWLLLVAASHHGVKPVHFWRLVCALGGRLWDRLGSEQERIAVATTERWLDGRASEDELSLVWFHAVGTGTGGGGGAWIASEWLAAVSPGLIAPADVSVLCRDLLGNPCRLVIFDPSWRTSAAVGVAQTMYDAYDFAAMPILADALEDAGCSDPDVLGHCRCDGPHVRGCWVVDLILSKE